MEWVFDEYRLCPQRAELTGPRGPIAIEKQPLDLLILLVANADRVVTKDEICEKIWNGRIVSDATVSTAVKSARRAVGDDGSRQATIKTIHGRGFRFVAKLQKTRPVDIADDMPVEKPVGSDKPSIAVLRFQFFGDPSKDAPLADAIPAELIAAMSRIKWARIIARGSSFRFDPEGLNPSEAGQKLGARYLVAGTVETLGDTVIVSTEVILSATGALIWSDQFSSERGDILTMRRRMVTSVLSILELELPNFEAEAARHLDSRQFDAWSHYHLGLRHVYRFNKADNDIARQHFARALELDPDFARAHAGQSLSHWQTAFMAYDEDRRAPLDLAVAAANRALELDEQDPFANFNMGRARWLQGEAADGLPWLDRALLVNPNYAQCHYSQGLNRLLVGDSSGARDAAAQAMTLSPLDPLYYAMLALTAMTHFKDGDYRIAVETAETAARSPGSHFYIDWIAAIAQELSGNRVAAEKRLAEVRRTRTELSQALFFGAFPIADQELRNLFSGAMTRLGIA